jgi:hypothetical protein
LFLHSLQAVVFNRGVVIALSPSGWKRPLKQILLFINLKKIKKVEFRFGPKEHALHVLAKSAEKSGHGEEWVKYSLYGCPPKEKICSIPTPTCA